MFEIGSSLERAREERGFELADAEAATRIRARYLVALEEERFDDLPDGYARAFLRSYASYLWLDAQRLVDEYDARFPPERPVSARRPPRRRREWASPRAAVLLLAGALALVALLVAGHLGSGKRIPALPDGQPAAGPPRHRLVGPDASAASSAHAAASAGRAPRLTRRLLDRRSARLRRRPAAVRETAPAGRGGLVRTPAALGSRRCTRQPRAHARRAATRAVHRLPAAERRRRQERHAAGVAADGRDPYS